MVTHIAFLLSMVTTLSLSPYSQVVVPSERVMNLSEPGFTQIEQREGENFIIASSSSCGSAAGDGFLSSQTVSLADSVPQHHGQREESKRLASIISEIEKALQSGSPDALSGYFAPKVFLNLRGDGNGYYSANQAHYVLKEFIIQQKLSNIKLSEQASNKNETYASGSATILIRGKRESVKLYIGFIAMNNSYRVSQFTIY